ncbi:MAG: serine/threonine-protein kinase [Actinomycetota bacterium]
MLLVNEILHNRYRILRQLGHGGMGAVYEAHDSVFDTTCALKEIMIAVNPQNPKQHELILRAFEREAKILAKIKHEAVPHVRDYFTDTNRQFLVMELVEGKDLGGLLEERQTPFPLEDVLRWMEQLLDGLDYLHTQNPPIYHRDLKPQNLKITPRGKIKLLDFGIAKGGSEPPNSTTINNQTFVAATLNYSPIEQIFRVLDPVFREVLTQRFESKIKTVMEQNADARSDLYALGATTYHLLTGVLPIDSLKRMLEVWSNKPDPLDNPTRLNNRIPPEISTFLLKSMEVDHDKRFVSALEMQQALHETLAKIKAREANQMENTLELSNQNSWLSEQERLRQIEAQRQQQTHLGGGNIQDAATQQISVQQLNPEAPRPISEQTIQRTDGVGYTQPFIPLTNDAPQNPNSPFNTGGSVPFTTGDNQYHTGGTQPPTEMVNLAGVSTGGSLPPNNPGSTGGAFYSNNPISPNPAYLQNQDLGGQKKSRKILWILPVLALLFLGLAGAGAGFWLWQQSNGGETVDTNTNQSPTSTATTTATPKPSMEPTSNSNGSSGIGATPTITPVTKPTNQVKPNLPQTPLQPAPNRQKEPNARPKKKVSVDDIINDTE